MGTEMDEEFCWKEWTEELSEPSGADHDRLAAAGEIQEGLKNIEACRYCNILPYDRTLARLVPLPTPQEWQAPYINASTVTLAETPGKRYIISQAPRDDPVDFWRLVLSNQVETIVALAKIEQGYSGCSDYFPKDMAAPARTFHTDATREHTIIVRLVEPPRSIVEGLEERKFDVSHYSSAVQDNSDPTLSTKRVHHFHYKNWPNYGVPTATGAVRALVHSIIERQNSRQPQASVLVHCSGGVGRSGVFLTLLAAMQNSVPEARPSSIVPIVNQLRSQRHPWCVETFEQYKFCYQALMEEWDGWSPTNKFNQKKK